MHVLCISSLTDHTVGHSILTARTYISVCITYVSRCGWSWTVQRFVFAISDRNCRKPVTPKNIAMYRNHLGILSNENEYFSTQPIFSIDTVRREDGRRKEERQTNKTGDHQSCSICCCCVGEDTVSRVCVSIMQTSHRIPAHRHQIKKTA